jgi:hypothetical protein
MLALYSFTICLGSSLSATNIVILYEILRGFLCIFHGGGVRTLSRYTSCSERTLSRFMEKIIDWKVIFIKIFKHFIYTKMSFYILAADETIEGKAGSKTHGVDYYYSSILKMPIRSVNLFGFSLINVESGKSSPLGVEQVVYNEGDKARIAADKAKKLAGKGQPKGRKKGTKNAAKGAIPPVETASFRAFKTFFMALMALFATLMPEFKIAYLVVDSAYGNLNYLKLAKEKGLCIISKLRAAPALFFPYQGDKKAKKYGDKVDINNLPQKYLVSSKTENGILYQVYQYQAWNKEMSEFLLNVVSVVLTNLETNKKANTHFFSNDLQINAEDMLKFYKLRFQIEFDFRETKQLFGLHKMKNFEKIQMNNMFHLAFLALLTARIWQKQWAIKLNKPKLSLIDLKTIFKAQSNLKQAIELDKKTLYPFFNQQFIDNFVPNDIINAD